MHGAIEPLGLLHDANHWRKFLQHAMSIGESVAGQPVLFHITFSIPVVSLCAAGVARRSKHNQVYAGITVARTRASRFVKHAPGSTHLVFHSFVEVFNRASMDLHGKLAEWRVWLTCGEAHKWHAQLLFQSSNTLLQRNRWETCSLCNRVDSTTRQTELYLYVVPGLLEHSCLCEAAGA